MNKILIWFIVSDIFMMLHCAVNAQGTLINGTVKINREEPALFAEVSIYDSTSGKLIAGTVCDSTGYFKIKIEPNDYTLKINFLSFKTYTRNITVKENNKMSLGIIILEPSDTKLEEITVKGERSRMELSFEKRVFSVGKDITSMGGSILDVLNNVPSLMADLKGNISLRGNNSVRILINGQPSKIYRNGSMALQSLPAELIQKIEVITNPSARYEAEGSAGIINIILKKNSEIGFHGNIGLMQRLPEASLGTANLNFRRGRINWFFNGSFAYNADPAYQRTYQRFSSSDTSYIYRELNNGNETDYHGDYETGADINISPHQSLSVSNLFHFENKNDYWNGYYFDSTSDGIFLDQIKILNQISGGERANEATVEYENDIGRNHKLTVSAEYDYGKEKELPYIREQNLQNNADTTIHQISDIRMNRFINIRADYVLPVLDSGKLETGIRGIHNLQDYNYQAREKINDAWQILPIFNNNYLSLEKQAAAYVTLSSGWKPFLYQLGLRAEYYRIHSELKQTGKGTSQSYVSLFPSLYLTYKFSPARSLQLSYSRRISRPDARDLLPASDYSSSRDRYTGNPDLQPEFNNSFNGQYLQNWESGSLLLSIYYRHRTGVIEKIISLDSTGIMRRIPINLSIADAWGIEFSTEKEIGDNLKLSAGANLYKYHSNGIYNGNTYRTSTDHLTGLLRLEWIAPGDLKIQTSTRYFGPSKTIQGHRSAYWYLNLAIAKDIFKGNGTLSLNSGDLFTTRIEKFTVSGPEYYSMQRYWEPYGIRLNFVYRINEGKEDE